jgi:cyclophilin family peptidyl-prolyl cis-trans isomerase
VALGDRQNEFLAGVDADPAVVVQNAYLNVLGGMTSPETFSRILLGLKSERIDVRIGAADALYSRKEQEVVQVAWQAYQDNKLSKFDRVRESLIYTIAKVESEQTTQYLREMLSDPDFDVASVAHQFLTQRKIPNLPAAPQRPLTFSPFREGTFTHNPQVMLYTTKGIIQILCFAKQAPIHVANFVGQVQSGFYDGKPWFRVVPNFVVQGGANDEMGMQGSDYNLRAEINGIPFGRGALGMPRSDDFNTGDVQLFLTHVPTPHLDGQYTVFGQIISGWRALDKLEQGDRILRAVVRR